MSGPGTRNYYTPALAIQIYGKGTAELPDLPSTTTLARLQTAQAAVTTTGSEHPGWNTSLEQIRIINSGVTFGASGTRLIQLGDGQPNLEQMGRILVLTQWAMAAQQTTSTPIGTSTSSGAKTVTRVAGKPDSGMLTLNLRRSYSAGGPSRLLKTAVGQYARVYIQQDFSGTTVSNTKTEGTRDSSNWESSAFNPISVMDCIVTDVVKIDTDVEMADASMMNMQWPITGDIIEIE